MILIPIPRMPQMFITLPIDNNLSPYFIDTTVLTISFFIGVLIPMFTAILTHITAPMWIRSTFNFGLSALSGTLTTITIADYRSVNDYLLAITFAWLATMRSHYAGMADPITIATANFGIGRQSKTGTLSIPDESPVESIVTTPSVITSSVTTPYVTKPPIIVPPITMLPPVLDVTPNAAITPAINISATEDPAIHPDVQSMPRHSTGG